MLDTLKIGASNSSIEFVRGIIHLGHETHDVYRIDRSRHRLVSSIEFSNISTTYNKSLNYTESMYLF